jgi:Uma2 family endonuclease
MAVMTIVDAWPASDRPFTVEDLDRMPDDGHRYELLDGVLIVRSRPTNVYQTVLVRLVRVLQDACADDLIALPEPALNLDETTELVPDIAVVPLSEVGGAKLAEPPMLVVEVRSPSTALIDLNLKKAAYERFGVPSYWVVDPDLEHPEVTVFEMRDGRYETVEKATETFTVKRPFPVTIRPTDLIRGISRQARS